MLLWLMLRHLSDDGQQLVDFTVSPVRIFHVDIAALSLSIQHINTSTEVLSLEPRSRLIAFTSEFN